VNPYEDGVRELVAELAELDPESIDLETSFSDAGIDSLIAMEIAVHVEAQFGVRFDDEELKRVQSVADLVGLVAKHADG
jgi:acyl carrier protein